MSAAQNNRGTTAGGITGTASCRVRAAIPAAGRRASLDACASSSVTTVRRSRSSCIRSWPTKGARTADRLEAARWLADRGFGKPPRDVELALKAQEAVDVHAFAAFAAKYLPPSMFDELILSVKRRMEAERALPQGHS
jgi:hypothetical protein